MVKGHLIQLYTIGDDAMREYSAKEKKLLEANPYTFKVTKNHLFFTTEFKEAFLTAYTAGMDPRKIIEDLGYDLSIFGQKQIDSIAQRIKEQALSPAGFRQGIDRTRRKRNELLVPKPTDEEQQPAIKAICNELAYLRQEVDFLKKL